jgi:sec-independent protein translocase protein TatA
MAQGIKAFKKGMAEDDTAKTDTKPADSMKTINANTEMKQQAETQKKFEGTV